MQRFGRRWIDDDVGGLAAGVAFYAVLAVFPTLLAVASALGSLESLVGGAVADDARRTVLEWMDLVLTDRAADTRGAVRRLFEEGDEGLFSVAFAAAVWSGSRGTNGVMRALSRIYRVSDARSFWRRRLVALALLASTVAAGTLALSMFVVGPLFGGGRAIASEVGMGDVFVSLWQWARLPLAFMALTGWAALVFHAAPDEHHGWRVDLPGALLTAFLWVVLSAALRAYLEVVSGANQVLGALGGALIVLVWLYLLALALLTGGLLNVLLIEARPRRHGSTARRWRRSP